ncbi:MAG: ParA family protein [Bacteroidales bacterium]
MKVISFASKKGGVGKTTSAILTGLILSKTSKVLMIDLDSQNAMTSFFFENIADFEQKTILEAVKGEIMLKEAIYKKSDNLDVIPTKLEFENINFVQLTGKELFLRIELESMDYDYVIIDTPPNLFTETVLGLAAAHTVVIPARLEKMDTRAIGFTLDKINSQIKKYYNPDLDKVYILPTQYNYQNRIVNDFALQTLKESFPQNTLDIIVKLNSSISKFNYVGYEKDSNLKEFEEYNALVEVLR